MILVWFVCCCFFFAKKDLPFVPPPSFLPCIPRYISIIKNIFSFKGKNARLGGEGKMLFNHTFITTCWQLDGKHSSLIRVSAVISELRNEHGAIFKDIFSLVCFPVSSFAGCYLLMCLQEEYFLFPGLLFVRIASIFISFVVIFEDNIQ